MKKRDAAIGPQARALGALPPPQGGRGAQSCLQAWCGPAPCPQARREQPFLGARWTGCFVQPWAFWTLIWHGEKPGVDFCLNQNVSPRAGAECIRSHHRPPDLSQQETLNEQRDPLTPRGRWTGGPASRRCLSPGSSPARSDFLRASLGRAEPGGGECWECPGASSWGAQQVTTTGRASGEDHGSATGDGERPVAGQIGRRRDVRRTLRCLAWKLGSSPWPCHPRFWLRCRS